MLDALGTAGNLLLVFAGFTFIILIHELGHFLAARWAGVRVEAFAIGFGPALFSYRPGLGFRAGSSEREARRLAGAADGRISPTEYRFNALPFGGYVKMLGQDDLRPGRPEDSPDSFMSKSVGRRMVIISAGVVFNVVLAALLFLLVFMVGLPTQPAAVGLVGEGSPAASASVVSGWDESDPGLKRGDRILRIGGDRPMDFTDIAVATAMAHAGSPLEIIVEREGATGPVTLAAQPVKSPSTGLLSIGVAPPLSALFAGQDLEDEAVRARLEQVLADAGLSGAAGATLESVNGEAVSSGQALIDALEQSGGEPVSATYRTPEGEARSVSIEPRAMLDTAPVMLPGLKSGDASVEQTQQHLLGLTPLLTVASAGKAARFGLRDGDIFARIGGVEWPGYAEGLSEIRRSAGREIGLAVVRAGELVQLRADVGGDGRIGFSVGTTADKSTIVAGTISRSGDPEESPADRLAPPPGARVVSIGGRDVASFTDMRMAIVAAAETAVIERGGGHFEIPVRLDLPLGDPLAEGPFESAIWRLTPSEVEHVRRLGWASPIPEEVFDLEEMMLKADGPLHAVSMGLAKTRQVMAMTYLTILRLVQGSVAVEQIKGPVGIASLGTRVADRGLIYLLFFMAIISVNLAVINFLPLPIVDGGHFVFLLVEGLTRRPVSAGVQQAVGLVGLLLVATVFIVVTFNDVRELLGM